MKNEAESRGLLPKQQILSILLHHVDNPEMDINNFKSTETLRYIGIDPV
jgi:hypothetical protein